MQLPVCRRWRVLGRRPAQTSCLLPRTATPATRGLEDTISGRYGECLARRQT